MKSVQLAIQGMNLRALRYVIKKRIKQGRRS